MYNRGNIVTVPVPFTDLSATKKRPVLVISNDAHNSTYPDMIVAAVTSNLFQHGIPITQNEMKHGQLPKPSIIRCDKIFTLDQSIVVKSIGNITDNVLDLVRTEIIKLITG